MTTATRNADRKPRSNPARPKIQGVDLFCGAGGLTKGLEAAGIEIAMGVDVDPNCEYPYAANNKAVFVLKSVADLEASEVLKSLAKAPITLIAGCAPCQPFSTYQRGNRGSKDNRWNLLGEFARLVRETKPDLVTMENVPGLEREKVFKGFVRALKQEGFHVSHAVVNCADYGVPQNRNRLVLLASKFGPIAMTKPRKVAKHAATVRKVISKLPPLKAGEVHPRDALHRACELSPLNLKRIRASKPGGTWRDWNSRLVADCHKKKTGKTYPSVYGRMTWDDPAPTMTTQYYGFGNGRFGHPAQDRAISLREGAIIQSFPRRYRFVPKGAPVHNKTIGRLIGNAVPVNLGKAIGKSLVRHVEAHKGSRKKDS